MAIRTFRAGTPAEALAQVKRDLGADAVILHTRTHKLGGILGIGARTVTEITATTEIAPRPRRATPARHRHAGADDRATARPAYAAAPAEPPTKRDLYTERADIVDLSSTTSRPTARAADVAEPLGDHDAQGDAAEGDPAGPGDLHTGARARPSTITEPKAPRPTPQAGPDRRSAAVEAAEPWLATEVASLKRMVGQVLKSSRGGACVGLGEPLERCYADMLDAGVPADFADEIAGAVRDELTPDEQLARDVVRAAATRHLAARIPVAAGDAPPRPGRPFVMSLVGPTGVGKTTTVAKLAAMFKLRLGRSVGLVTSDTYRIAAVDQLRTYANIIGVDLKVVLTPGEMARACNALADRDVVLIDTAGRSQHDSQRVDELRSFVEAASPDEVHLVLSTASSEGVMRRAAEAFEAVGPTHTILTKLDEAVEIGAAVAVVADRPAKLSYLTTGQEVPDQIERARADRLARAVLTPMRQHAGRGAGA